MQIRFAGIFVASLLLVGGCIPTAKDKGRDDSDAAASDGGPTLPDGGLGMGGAIGMGGAVAMGGTQNQGGMAEMGGVDEQGGAMVPPLCGETDAQAQCEAAARRAGTCYSRVCPENSLPPGAVRQSILAQCDTDGLVSALCMIGGDCEALVAALVSAAPMLAAQCEGGGG